MNGNKNSLYYSLWSLHACGKARLLKIIQFIYYSLRWSLAWLATLDYEFKDRKGNP